MTIPPKSRAEILYDHPRSRKAAGELPIKGPPPALVKKAMAGLPHPRSQPPKDRQSVDGRVGADAAAAAKMAPKAKSKPKKGKPT
jgi:hypothetical protein